MITEPIKEEDVIGKLTWEEIMKKYKPDISSKEADFILWEHTSFPIGGGQEVLNHIHDYFTGSASD